MPIIWKMKKKKSKNAQSHSVGANSKCGFMRNIIDLIRLNWVKPEIAWNSIWIFCFSHCQFGNGKPKKKHTQKKIETETKNKNKTKNHPKKKENRNLNCNAISCRNIISNSFMFNNHFIELTAHAISNWSNNSSNNALRFSIKTCDRIWTCKILFVKSKM